MKLLRIFFFYCRTYAFPLKVPLIRGSVGGLKDRNYRSLRLNVRYLRNVRKSCIA